MSKSIERRIPLDFLRIFAALYVTIFHWAGGGWFPEGLLYEYPFSGLQEEMNSFISAGWIGVDIFFAISGFVIVDSINRRNIFQFAKARFFRLIPAYWMITAITFILSFWTLEELDAVLFFKSLVGLNFVEGDSPFVPAAWTLGVEIEFYLLASLVFTLPFQKSRWQVFCWMYLSSVAILNVLSIQNSLLIAIWQFGPLFILGISLREFESRKGIWEIMLVLASSLLSILGLSDRLSTWSTFNSTRALVIAAIVIIGLSFALINSGSTTKANPRNSMFLSRITFISQLTYPFYLLHENFGEGVISIVYWLTNNNLLAIALGFGTCLLLSAWVLALSNRLTHKFSN